MIKEDVLVEYFDSEEPDKVGVYSYDRMDNTIVDGPIDTLSIYEAKKIYNIMGELYQGEIKLYER